MILATTLATILVVTLANPVFNQTNIEDNCTISSFSQVSSVVKNCKNIVVQSLSVPAGNTLELDLLDGATLTFKGTTKFGYGQQWKGPLVLIKGNNINVIGESASLLDGQGQYYWDGKGGSGTTKPVFLRINNANKSSFKNINMLNCPERCVSLGSSSQVTINGWNIDVSAGDINKLGHNTDGFDLSSVNGITITNTVVKNQDDCVAVNYGSNLYFSNLQCSGGHGLSLSVGINKSDGNKNIVSNVTFIDCTVKNSANGIHIKTHSDGTWGRIDNLTYKNIKMSGITNYGINVQQNYNNGGSHGDPKGNVPINGFYLNQITGTMASSKTIPVYILCGSGGCSNFQWSGISLTGGGKSNCNYVPNGFNCH